VVLCRVGGWAELGKTPGVLAAVLMAPVLHYAAAIRPPQGKRCSNTVSSLAGTAALIAVLSLHDRSLPKALGYVAVAFGVLLTALGIFSPEIGAASSILWFLISTMILSVVSRAVPCRPRTRQVPPRLHGTALVLAQDPRDLNPRQRGRRQNDS
jgi:hypothetical protein